MPWLATLLTAKPVLIGLHLGFAIIGIDAQLWLVGELIAGIRQRRRLQIAAFLGLLGFLASWIAGGYYYVRYYGALVKPVIKAGAAPWAHTIAMETKEHIFLFLIPLTLTIALFTLLDSNSLRRKDLSRSVTILAILAALIGLAVGALGFMVSAAARWG